MSTELIDLHLKLLVIQYGRGRVLRSLASIGDTSHEALEGELAELAKLKTTKSVRVPLTRQQQIDRVQLSPQQRTVVSAIVREYDNKRFLGEQRLVARFLREHGHLRFPKSREKAFPVVLSILAKLPLSELEKILSQSMDAPTDSEYSQLAGALMNVRPLSPTAKPSHVQ